jgi:hypothetical protein
MAARERLPAPPLFIVTYAFGDLGKSVVHYMPDPERR